MDGTHCSKVGLTGPKGTLFFISKIYLISAERRHYQLIQQHMVIINFFN